MQPGKDFIGIGVGALIFDEEGKILLTLRGRQAKNEQGKWEIPGGAVEFGETTEQAIKREVAEELGIEIQVGEMLQLCNHLIPDEYQHWLSPTYICTITAGEPKNLEPHKCDKIGWFTLEEAEQLPLSIVTKEDVLLLKKRESKLLPERIGCAVIVQNKNGEILLGKRKNSFKAGEYGMPGGRIEGKETTDAAAERELFEETGLTAIKLEYVGVIKHWQDTSNFIHFIYLCTDWSGTVSCKEPEKCEGWEWHNLEKLPKNILSGHKEALTFLKSDNTLLNI